MHNTPHTLESRQKMSKKLTGKKYPGRKKPVSFVAPPSQSGTLWYNNGEKNCRSKEHPGEGWILGKLPHKIREDLGPKYRRGFLRRELEQWAGKNKKKTPFCEWCFSEDDLEAHHILPKSKFPQHFNDDSNCRVMCKTCHVTCHKQGGY